MGWAATRACVFAFVAVMVLDFFLGMFLNSLYDFFSPSLGTRATRRW